jgi:purine nucleosidase
MIKVHVDTDLGGDIDDLCALAMLLRREDVEITGITTVAENGGKRAGYVRYVLELEGRGDIPVAAGADGARGSFRERPGLPAEERYGPEPIAAAPGPLDEALDLIKKSIDQGAMVVGIGPFTNLYLFDQRYPGFLERAKITLMGGYVYPPRAGFPQWGNEMDYNVQVDVRSARHVIEHGEVCLVPLSVSVETVLRSAYLPALRGSGRLGGLIARQAEAFADERHYETTFGRTCDRLPEDMINFQHDPLACAIALGWNQGVEIEEIPLILEEKEGWLIERIDERGKATQLVTKVDGEAFNQYWIDQVLNK